MERDSKEKTEKKKQAHLHFFAWRDSPLMVRLEIRQQRRKSLIHTHAQLVENIPLPSLVWCHYYYHIRQTLRVRIYLVCVRSYYAF